MARAIGWTAAALLAAGCGGPEFGAPMAQLRVNGFDLDVYRSGRAFQVVKVTENYRPESAFAYTALLTAERVTGCRVRRETLRGGPRRIAGRLDC